MQIRNTFFKVITLGCVMGMAQVPAARAEVSDENFKKLTEAVEQLSGKVQALEQTHEKDQETIKQLQGQVGKAKEIASEARLKADKAESVSEKPQQPVALVPDFASAATHNFVMAGDAEIQFAKFANQHGTFAMADFAPIFLFRANDNILFEAGFDITLQNNARGTAGYTTGVNLSFATIDYMYNDYVTIMGGDMLLPLGTYSERSAGWLNKIPDAPLARSIVPGNGIGAQLRGAIPVGQTGQSLTYSVFGVNGPGSADGSGHADQLDTDGNVGFTNTGSTSNLHGGLGAGGRLAYFIPFKPHYDLEIGVSGMGSPWVNSQLYSAGVVDMALHIGPSVEIKGELIGSRVQTSDKGTITPNGLWVQAGYKFAGLNLDLPFINSLELVGRYDTLNDGLGTRTQRGTVGTVYYLTNTLWLECDYEFAKSYGPNPPTSNNVVVQLSYGF